MITGIPVECGKEYFGMGGWTGIGHLREIPKEQDLVANLTFKEKGSA